MSAREDSKIVLSKMVGKSHSSLAICYRSWVRAYEVKRFSGEYNQVHQFIFLEEMASLPHDVSQLLTEWTNGSQAARDELMALVYEELRRLAHRHMGRERPGHTLQTSALVHEAFIRMVDQKDVQWESRAHFFAIAAQMMRRILVDYARSRGNLKRGGNAQHIPLDQTIIVSEERSSEVIALDDALLGLASFDQRKSQIVELRFFGGLSIEETAEVLGVSPGTIMRDWTLAKAWLRKEITGDNERID